MHHNGVLSGSGHGTDTSRQRQKLLIRQSCRKIKRCTAELAAGEAPAVQHLYESGAALNSLYEACTGSSRDENETDVEAMLGPLPCFLGQLKDNLEGAIGKIKEGPSAGPRTEGSEEALQALLALSTEWHQSLRQRRDEALRKRKSWEEKHPVQAAQEQELSLYTQDLLPLLEAPSARAISTAQWQEAETSLASLQVYLLENKISAEQVRSNGEKGIEPVLRNVLRQMEVWDAEGLGYKKDERVDLERAEKIWGRADKIGSGLNYLLFLDARGDEVDGVKPTTRSVFLLKSAPPVHLSFSPSRDVWLVKRLSQSRERLVDIVFDPDKAGIRRDDEPRWNAAYQELEALERLVEREAGHIGQETTRESRIEETIELLCAKFESFDMPLKADEDDSAFALMYVSWELTMRVAAALGVVPGAQP